MLHTETVDRSTLELLIKVQQKEYLKGFYLVGGTALSLLMGHCKSVDIDLFSIHGFDVGQMLENLSADFPFNLFFSANNTIKFLFLKRIQDQVVVENFNIRPIQSDCYMGYNLQPALMVVGCICIMVMDGYFSDSQDNGTLINR